MSKPPRLKSHEVLGGTKSKGKGRSHQQVNSNPKTIVTSSVLSHSIGKDPKSYSHDSNWSSLTQSYIPTPRRATYYPEGHTVYISLSRLNYGNYIKISNSKYGEKGKFEHQL